MKTFEYRGQALEGLRTAINRGAFCHGDQLVLVEINNKCEPAMSAQGLLVFLCVRTGQQFWLPREPPIAEERSVEAVVVRYLLAPGWSGLGSPTYRIVIEVSSEGAYLVYDVVLKSREFARHLQQQLAAAGSITAAGDGLSDARLAELYTTSEHVRHARQMVSVHPAELHALLGELIRSRQQLKTFRAEPR